MGNNMSNVYQLDHYRPKPKIKVRQLDQAQLIEQFSKTRVIGKIKDQEQQLMVLNEAWTKFQGMKHYHKP
jgi:hypothetical protein